jgi:regulator of replication initiation timing
MNIEQLEKPKLSKVKMNCDDIIDMKLTKFPMVEDLWSRSSFNTVVGKMGQGKTSLITNLIKKVFKGCYNNIYVFIPENSRASIENDIYGRHLPTDCLYNDLNEENLHEVYEKMQESSANGEHSLLLIDDFQVSLKDPSVIAVLQKIVTEMRHLRSTIFLLQQNFQALAKKLRELISNVITFNVGKSQLNKMFDEIIQLDKDKYQQLIDFAFKEKNDWIAININGNRNIYKMFDRIIFENK